MNAKSKQTKHKIKNIRTKKEYYEFVNELLLTDEERQIMDFVFVNGYDYNRIADELCLTESSIKHKMSKILNKI